MIVLRSYNPFPSGEFRYEQPYPGGVHIFGGDGLSIDQQGKRVLGFRKGNNLPGATLAEVVKDISVFTCARLNGSSQWCVDSDAPVQVYSQSTGGGCSTCGGPPK